MKLMYFLVVSMWLNVLIVNCFGQKRQLNKCNIKKLLGRCDKCCLKNVGFVLKCHCSYSKKLDKHNVLFRNNLIISSNVSRGAFYFVDEVMHCRYRMLQEDPGII